jgi:hypothetical protein
LRLSVAGDEFSERNKILPAQGKGALIDSDETPVARFFFSEFT